MSQPFERQVRERNEVRGRGGRGLNRGGGFDRGRGQSRGLGPRGNLFHFQRTLDVSTSPDPPVGKLLDTISHDSVKADVQPPSRVGITGCAFVASYNSLNDLEPIVIVPGKDLELILLR